MANLLIITSAYPYYPGEQFIETEIQFLAKVFEKIYVLPLDGDAQQPHRPLPANVFLLDEVRSFRKRVKRNLSSRTIGLYKQLSEIIEEIKGRKGFFIRHPKALCSLIRTGSSAGQISTLVARLVSETKPDLIYSYWLSVGTLSAATALEKTKANTPLVSRVHGGDLYEERHTPPYCPFQAFLLSRLKALIPISRDGEIYLKTKYSERIGNKLKTFRLGVLPNRKSLMSSDETLRIVSCSSLTLVKRINLIVQSLGLIEFPILWTHIGDGPLRSVVESQAQNLQAKRVNIRITFLGQIPNHEVLSFYENNPVDIFLNVSSSEGIPVSIMEAMSRGIPTIATAVGGTPEIVDESLGTGFLLSEDINSEEIAQTITFFNSLPQCKKEEMRDKAYLKWFTDFNAEKNYGEFADFLKKLSCLR